MRLQQQHSPDVHKHDHGEHTSSPDEGSCMTTPHNDRRPKASDNITRAYRKAILTTWAEIEATGPFSTKTLHEEQDGRPAITLTTYKCELPEWSALKSLFPLRKPQSFSSVDKTELIDVYIDRQQPKFNHHFLEDIDVACDDIQLDDTTAALEKPITELSEHFERLKSEYEVKIGRCWTPLIPWSREKWDWDEGGESVSELDGHEWLERDENA
jgi:hypothetical protein